MGHDMKRITNRHLAEFFLAKSDPASIMPELFNLFGFDCMVRSNVNTERLDKLIRVFETEEGQNADTLTEIIEVIRKGKISLEKQETLLLEQIRSHINDHLIEDLRIEEMASSLHISYYYLCHFFKQHTGFTPIAYRNRKRIEKSMHLLAETEQKIIDIAADCGFGSSSYFTECFTSLAGMTPTAFRSVAKNVYFHPFYDLEDMLLAVQYETCRFMEQPPEVVSCDCVQTHSVSEPDERFSFLHETAIIEWKGVLYASWYCCPTVELHGYTPICGRRSYDGGATWSPLEVLAEDPTGHVLYCPPVYGISDGKLYLMMNQMVAADHIHSMDLYVLNEETDKFEFLWSRPIPFKLNTNAVMLPNGKLMLPGRIGELDRFPNTPAVLISDSGKMDDEWRLVQIAENGDLPDGTVLVHPELSVICCENTLYMFCRNDRRRVPLVYLSTDFGETWSEAKAHDFPYVRSKVYCGSLSDGRNYLIANVEKFAHKHDRSRLCLYLSKPGSMQFTKKLILFDTETAPIGDSCACHYPAAFESGGKLYIIATRSGKILRIRGAVLFVVNLSQI